MYLVTVLEKSGDHGCLAVQSWPPISCPSVSQTIPPCPPKKPNDIARKLQKHKRRGPVPRHTSATARSDHAALCERPPEAPSPLCPSRPLGRPPCATSFHCFAPPVDRGAPRPGIARGGPAPRRGGGPGRRPRRRGGPAGGRGEGRYRQTVTARRCRPRAAPRAGGVMGPRGGRLCDPRRAQRRSQQLQDGTTSAPGQRRARKTTKKRNP